MPRTKSYRELQTAIAALGSPERAEGAMRFFKTGKGQYGEGDVFVGASMPALRTLLRSHQDISDVEALLASPIHEERMFALLAMVRAFEREPSAVIYERYLAAARAGRINNWDLVDASAPNIVGGWLLSRSRKPLYALARSKSLWERRIAIVATFAFIRAGECADTFAIAEMLINDREDLMHKATGWMLREVGKRASEPALREFLDEHAPKMPRTMLRYAIERLTPADRSLYLARR